MKNTKACERCSATFDYLVVRPHHCRICGKCVCSKCASDFVDGRRVCYACVLMLTHFGRSVVLTRTREEINKIRERRRAELFESEILDDVTTGESGLLREYHDRAGRAKASLRREFGAPVYAVCAPTIEKMFERQALVSKCERSIWSLLCQSGSGSIGWSMIESKLIREIGSTQFNTVRVRLRADLGILINARKRAEDQAADARVLSAEKDTNVEGKTKKTENELVAATDNRENDGKNRSPPEAVARSLTYNVLVQMSATGRNESVPFRFTESVIDPSFNDEEDDRSDDVQVVVLSVTSNVQNVVGLLDTLLAINGKNDGVRRSGPLARRRLEDALVTTGACELTFRTTTTVFDATDAARRRARHSSWTCLHCTYINPHVVETRTCVAFEPLRVKQCMHPSCEVSFEGSWVFAGASRNTCSLCKRVCCSEHFREAADRPLCYACSGNSATRGRCGVCRKPREGAASLS